MCRVFTRALSATSVSAGSNACMHAIGPLYPPGTNKSLRIASVQVTDASTLVLEIPGVRQYGWEVGLPA